MQALEIENYKARIKRIKQRKGKSDQGYLTCKNCRKDFQESQNFSWKCCTHRSEYSKEDDLWWCCLKKGVEQKGCKLQKHEPLDEDEDEEELELKNKRRIQFTRCLCCKELGHAIEECPRDPNLKTVTIN